MGGAEGEVPWRGRRVLVVGASGFLGRWCVWAARRAGAEVTALVRDRRAAESALAGVGLTAEEGPLALHVADLMRPGAAAEAVAACRPQTVLDLAGYGVDPAERREGDRARATRLHAELPVELAEALARHRPDASARPTLVRAGSAAEYGAAAGDLAEETPPRPLSLYGRTKLAGTRALAERARALGLATLTARLFTVYGPGEHRGRLLPSLLEAARHGEPLDLTDGTQERDFAHVRDVAEALVELAEHPAEPGDCLNLATGRLHSVREFAETAARVLQIPEGQLRFGALPTRGDEMRHSPVAVVRLRARLGRALPDRLAEGIAETAELAGRSAARP